MCAKLAWPFGFWRFFVYGTWRCKCSFKTMKYFWAKFNIWMETIRFLEVFDLIENYFRRHGAKICVAEPVRLRPEHPHSNIFISLNCASISVSTFQTPLFARKYSAAHNFENRSHRCQMSRVFFFSWHHFGFMLVFLTEPLTCDTATTFYTIFLINDIIKFKSYT